MKAKIKEEISIENFIRLCAVLERIPFPDINELSNIKMIIMKKGLLIFY